MRKIITTFIIFSGLILLLISTFNCKKQAEVIQEMIINHDTIYLTDSVLINDFVNEEGTKFILIRHGETDGIGSNPGLSAVGQQRIEKLKYILKNVQLESVYSTNFNRTLNSAEPIALDHDLDVTIYNFNDLDGFVDQVLAAFNNDIVLVVGHRDTTPELLNVLTGSFDFLELTAVAYDNFYLVTVFSKGDANVLHFKY